jgi:hypothetical protein
MHPFKQRRNVGLSVGLFFKQKKTRCKNNGFPKKMAGSEGFEPSMSF